MPSHSSSFVVEIARFGVKAGTEPAAVLAAAKQSQAYVASCAGFVSRRLCEPTEQEPLWMDILEWRDLASAEAAAAGLGDSQHCAAFLSLIDGKSVRMDHPVGHTF